jgi:hypothetical protein
MSGESLDVRLLSLRIQEPLPGRVFREMAEEHGAEEAARRYRATVVTTLRQLRGLAEMRLRLLVAPEDGHEAVRFWLLPRLADAWQCEGTIFRSQGWEIDFGGEPGNFRIEAEGEILCPNLGARWVHTALLGLGRTTHQVIGPACGGGEYFRASSTGEDAGLPPRILPELPVIRTDDHWQEAIGSALGPALKRAWVEEGGDPDGL